MHRRSPRGETSLADILRYASDDVLAANKLSRKKNSTQAQPEATEMASTQAPESVKSRRKKGQRKAKVKGPSEHEEQTRLIAYAAKYPKLASLFAIPNGGFRTKATAGKLKAEGVKSGVPDLFLPVASQPSADGPQYHGMFIEMKIQGNRPTNNQVEWLQKLATNGYYCIVAYGAEAALERLLWYTKGGQ